MNTERPVDEEPKYKRSRYCDNLKKRRRRNDPNRKYAEQYSIERKNLEKKIWGGGTSPNLKGTRKLSFNFFEPNQKCDNF